MIIFKSYWVPKKLKTLIHTANFHTRVWEKFRVACSTVAGLQNHLVRVKNLGLKSAVSSHELINFNSASGFLKNFVHCLSPELVHTKIGNRASNFPVTTFWNSLYAPLHVGHTGSSPPRRVLTCALISKIICPALTAIIAFNLYCSVLMMKHELSSNDFSITNDSKERHRSKLVPV